MVITTKSVLTFSGLVNNIRSDSLPATWRCIWALWCLCIHVAHWVLLHLLTFGFKTRGSSFFDPA